MAYNFHRPFDQQVIVKTKVDENAANPIDRLDWIWPEVDDYCWRKTRADWPEHERKWFRHTRNFGVAIQAGGCCGMYPRMLAERFRAVYTFEPFPLNFYCLTLNCQRANILKFQAALSNKSGFCSLRVWEDNLGMTKVIEDSTDIIQMVKLDDLHFSSCDLLALDVEDHELETLMGAIKTVERCRPTVIAENGQRVEIVSLLDALNYRLIDVSMGDSIYIPKEI